MALLEWQTGLCPSTRELALVNNNMSFNSSITNKSQIVSYMGDYWTMSMTFNNMDFEKQRLYTVMIGKLKGMLNTIKVPTFRRYRDDEIGTPVVVSGNSLAMSVTLSGLIPGAKVFSSGDYITIEHVLYEVLDDSYSDGSGICVVNINKMIRTSMTSGSAVEYKRPYCEMRLTESSNGYSEQPLFASGTLSFKEKI